MKNASVFPHRPEYSFKDISNSRSENMRMEAARMSSLTESDPLLIYSTGHGIMHVPAFSQDVVDYAALEEAWSDTDSNTSVVSVPRIMMVDRTAQGSAIDTDADETVPCGVNSPRSYPIFMGFLFLLIVRKIADRDTSAMWNVDWKVCALIFLGFCAGMRIIEIGIRLRSARMERVALNQA